MYEAAARSLRTSERFLTEPPLVAQFGSHPVSVCDISAKGGRFRHTNPLEMGNKAALRLVIDGRPSPANVEAVVVWTQADPTDLTKFTSGVRIYAAAETMQKLLRSLLTAGRITRIEELRGSERFRVGATNEQIPNRPQFQSKLRCRSATEIAVAIASSRARYR